MSAINSDLNFQELKPSLCDRCLFAYNIRGGSVGIHNTVTGEYKEYPQRYCSNENLPKEQSTCIHFAGYQECIGFKEKP